MQHSKHTLTRSGVSRFAAALALVAVGVSAQAQSYPSKPITVVVPFGVGGSADLTARTVAEKLQAALGRTIVVENRTGAGGETGTNSVVRAAPDGYTLLMTPNGPITTGGLFKKQPYNVKTDLIPITMVTNIPLVLAANAALPANTVKEFLDYAKKHPNAISYGNPGTGSANWLNMELLRHEAAITMTGVPYRGNGAAAMAVGGGEVQVGSGDFASYLPLGPAPIGSGRVKFLATFTHERAKMTPNLPAIGEVIPGFVPVTGWVGLYAPAGTPKEIVDRLHAETVKVLNLPEVKAVFEKAGMEEAPMDRAKFTKAVHDEIDGFTKRVKAANLQIE